MSAESLYDKVQYPTYAMIQSHPDRLHVVGRLFGLSPKPATECRYLEIGCGSGTNLIAMAIQLPEARFTGIDLSEAAIQEGQKVIAELQLKNIILQQADLTRWVTAGGQFDYITAHGVYSWVPSKVRDALLELSRKALSANGLLYLSFNALPGCYIRKMFWDMLAFHTQETTTPAEKLAQARGFLEFLQLSQAKVSELQKTLVNTEVKRMLNPELTHLLFHDDMSEINEPEYFVDFVRYCQKFGFRFVADSDVHSMNYSNLSDECVKIMSQLQDSDPILKEQYLDFVKLRRFRRSILTNSSQRVLAELEPAAIEALYASVTSSKLPDGLSMDDGVESMFESEHGARLAVRSTVGKLALQLLFAACPGRIHFQDLIYQIASSLQRSANDASLIQETRETLRLGYLSGLIDLHAVQPDYCRSAGERPTVLPLARIQVRQGKALTTMFHSTLHLEDEASRTLIGLLDGSRDRKSVVRDMRTHHPTDQDDNQLLQALEDRLAHLGRVGLLVA